MYSFLFFQKKIRGICLATIKEKIKDGYKDFRKEGIVKKLPNLIDRLPMSPKDAVTYSYLTRGGTVLECNKCGVSLGVWHMMRQAIFKKKRGHYSVICKRCGHVNERIKGEFKRQTEEEYKALMDAPDLEEK